MSCCNEPATALTNSPANPRQHVNYAKGMVLGVDDFTQEFAYLSGRDQWLAREALGYGTLSGLRVFIEPAGTEGPRVHVNTGTALAPSGQLICVPADQCCVLNRWLAKPENAAIVNRLLGAASPPMSPPTDSSATVSLYLTLCYVNCLTASVPIPGEPCRSAEDLMAPSRIADDFRLELRAAPPAQVEESAVRDFIAWLRTGVRVLEAASSPPGDETAWLAALRAAVQPWIAAFNAPAPSSPPSAASLGDFLFDVSPPALTIGRSELCALLRVALRVWVTELRPWWMARPCAQPAGADDDCLLLARVDFPIIWDDGSPTGFWNVDGDEHDVIIDESTRPVLAHLRLLQEWLLCGCDCGAGTGPASAARTVPATATGGIHVPLQIVNANVTLDASHHIVLCDGDRITVTLPKCSLDNFGRVYIVKSIKLPVTLQSSGSDNINGSDKTKSLAQGHTLTVVSDGVKIWQIIGSVP